MCRLLLLSSSGGTRLEFNDFQFTRSAIVRDPLTNCTILKHTHTRNETELDSTKKNYIKRSDFRKKPTVDTFPIRTLISLITETSSYLFERLSPAMR